MNIVAEAIVSARIAPAPARTGEAAGAYDMQTRYRAPTMPRMAEVVLSEPGAFGTHVLIVGDPKRVELLATEVLEDAQLVGDARGMVGYVGTFNGKRVGIQTHGIGGASAALVVEELVQAGVTRIVRLGTFGSLSPAFQPGDLLCAAAAIPHDGASRALVGGEPHAPMADFEIVHAAVHDAKHLGVRMRVGLVATTDLYFDPDDDLDRRWAARGAVGVDMETATLLTLAPLRGISAGSFLVCSNVVDAPATQWTADEHRAAFLTAAPVALGALLSEPKPK